MPADAAEPDPAIFGAFEATRQTLTVPAGRFERERYASGESTVWVTGPDRVPVRFAWPSLDREYVPTTLHTDVEKEVRR